MKAGKNQRALLMELLVVVLFFGLCATVLLQTFMAARETSRRAGLQGEALTKLQVFSERLYAAEDVENCLTALGFELVSDECYSEYYSNVETLFPDGGEALWKLDSGDYTLLTCPTQENAEAGVLRDVALMAVLEDEVLAQLHSVRYLPREVSK